VELRHVEPVRLAYAMTPRLIAAIVGLCVLRAFAGALLPLSADEAYYWLWSRHLAAGYYDHPPAIAFLIRAGTFVFGQTSFGVRAGGILLSFVASALVWRTGAILSGDEKTGARACLFFNLTAMATVETLSATPDAPALVCAAAFFFCLAKIAETADGRWWLAAGLCAGLGLLSKYTALFLGVGALAWLIASPPMRRWLISPWPYLGGVVAAAIFAPNLLWNVHHGWVTFAFQFGRVEGDGFTLRYLFEFLGAQAVLASPFILILGVMGLVVSRNDPRPALIAAMILPSVAYFAWHSLHDRVQGNWPSFLYPLFCIAAAMACTADWRGWQKPLARWSAKLAVPVAAILLLAAYAQALLGVVPLGRGDPLARLLAVGMPQVTQKIADLRHATGAGAIITTDYATTSWLDFYGQPGAVQIGEDFRWPDLPPPDASLFAKPALYVTEARRDEHLLIAAHFRQVSEIARFDRRRHGVAIAHYVVYRVEGLLGAPAGKQP
jgi:4-amino-4-deoxy-L-arabinose transferase-like glycosyltransferase